jgi:hypothetical protein
MNSCELVTFITAISCGIAKCFPKEELPLISAIFTELADTLSTIVVVEELNATKELSSIEASTNNKTESTNKTESPT